MDVIVTPAEGGTVWQLTDLLGRSMGRITSMVNLEPVRRADKPLQ